MIAGASLKQIIQSISTHVMKMRVYTALNAHAAGMYAIRSDTMKVLKKGNTEIGAFDFPDRRKPMLGIRIGNEVICYGSFRSKESADDFMEELAELVGAEPEESEKE
jgi:hypothetical protein